MKCCYLSNAQCNKLSYPFHANKQAGIAPKNKMNLCKADINIICSFN